MENGARKPSLPCALHQEFKDAFANPFPAAFAQYGHPANLHVTLVLQHPATSDGIIAVQRERMKSMSIVLVHLHLFGHVLLVDKHLATNCPRLFHLTPLSNFDHFEWRIHGLIQL
jgi:hypothetical protein